MAAAIPVNSKRTKAAPAAPVVTLGNVPENAKDVEAAKAELLAKAEAIVATEVPDVPDELVNTLGQEKNYGKIKSVDEMVYGVRDGKGDLTGATRVHLRINH